MLRRGERFDLASAQKQVKDYLAAILKPEDTELSFWQAFAEGKYQPGLLFDDADILPRIEHHPMALWKCGGRAPKQKIHRRYNEYILRAVLPGSSFILTRG